ncbi:MAG: hypothetical protein K2K14_06690 [Ruminococcus sp.]|nr:hypothetical protein [Ruminococcus sp.]
MKKLKVYKVYMEDVTNGSCYSTFVPAENEKEAVKYCEGNGECVAVKDVTEDYPISEEFLFDTLKDKGYGRAEIEIITRTLELVGLSE